MKWLVVGSVPCAFAGAVILDRFAGPHLADQMKIMLGVVLLLACVAMVVRLVLVRRREAAPIDASRPVGERAPVRIVPTIIVGAVGGLIVGLTSVGSGSLMIVALIARLKVLHEREKLYARVDFLTGALNNLGRIQPRSATRLNDCINT
mgnify:CR=1 FL=1